MFKNHSILAVIPAKRKSRRLPEKNIRLFAGKPLIAWSIMEARKSRFLDEVIVSTESEEIARISRRWGAEVPFKRPPSLVRAHISSIDVARHAAIWSKSNRRHFDLVIILQPTSPLRTARDIDKSIKQFFEKDADALMSITRVTKSPFWMKKINKKGYLEDLFKGSSKRKTRNQSIYMLNGAVYIVKIGALLSNKINRIAFYLMDNSRSVDIDNRLDFEIAQWLMRARKKSPG